MCLYERDIRLLGVVFLLQIAQLCFLFVTPEGRAGLAGVAPKAVLQPLARALLHALPAAGLIKLFHDWIGSDDKSVCVGRLVYLVGCFLLCAALELQSFASKTVETNPDDLALSTRYPVRWWSLAILFGTAWFALQRHVSFK